MVRSSHLNEGFSDKAKQYAINLTASALITLSAALPVKSQSLEGNVTNVLTQEPIPGLVVSVPVLGDGITDDNGDYAITQNAVRIPKYRIITPGNNLGIYNVEGKLVDETEWDGKPFLWNKNVSSGKYFAFDGINQAYDFVKLGNEPAWINMKPVNLEDIIHGKTQRTTQGLDETYILLVDGEGNYHDFTRQATIRDNSTLDFFMIPVQSRGDSTDWYYPTVLHGFKEYSTAWNGNAITFHPGDTPFNIYRFQEYPTEFGADWPEVIESAINDAENNGEWNWYNNDVSYVTEDRIASVDKGVILDFVRSPTGGGLAYTHVLARYPDETPYLWRIELDTDLIRAGAEVTIRREFGRQQDLRDAVPPEINNNYIMVTESAGGYPIDGHWYYHPQEKGILGLKWYIQEYGETTGQYTSWQDAPNMDWYITEEE